MGFSVTALQLTNRVRRLRRMPDVGSISETEDLATLDAINASIEEVLSSRRWEFDMRRAQIALRPYLTDLTLTSTVGFTDLMTVYRADGLTEADTYGDYVVRLLPSGSTNHSRTALRVRYSSVIVTGNSSFMTVTTDIDEALDGVAGRLFYAEYVLPDTVRDVIRFTHQQEELTLDQIDPVVEFDELYPTPNIEFGAPRLVSVGGLDVSTYSVESTAPSPGLRLIVWPIPDESYILDYTYHYRHPELTTATDTLDGVPQDVVYQIVDLAAAKMKAFYEKDYDALRLSAFSTNKIGQIHSQQGGMYADRKPVGNWDGSAGRVRMNDWLRGRLIGGG